ncbi:MAG: Mobile element protein, partial [uncultured Thermomicrobiales bacterium]
WERVARLDRRTPQSSALVLSNSPGRVSSVLARLPGTWGLIPTRSGAGCARRTSTPGASRGRRPMSRLSLSGSAAKWRSCGRSGISSSRPPPLSHARAHHG